MDINASRGMQAGADEDKVAEIRTWRESERFSEAERAALEYAEAMTITGQRITYLYDIMDSAYDAAKILEHSRALGHVPVVDINFRANADLKAEHQAEAKRRALIHLPDPAKAIYNFRTMVERINARLKDEFGGRFVRVRGAMKVKCHLMFGMLALTVDQIFRAFKPDPVPT